MAGPRDYKKEYQNYQGKPAQIKARSERNHARRELVAAGVNVAGKDVDHKTPLVKGGSPAARSNLRAISPHANRSFPRTSKAGMK